VSVVELVGIAGIELVAVTENVSDCGATRAGTVGAVKVWIEPSAAPGVRTTAGPAVCVQVKVSVPPLGSTPVAVRVTAEALGTGLAGAELAKTDGAVPGGGGTIGTLKVVVFAVVVLPPPTVKEKPRLNGAPTTGAIKVAVALVGLMMVTCGSPGFTICAHWNGPLTGVLPAELRVTVVPAVIGVVEPLKLATAFARPPGGVLGEQPTAGVTLSGNGLSCPTD
jgi:hypothetical protein